MIHFSYTFGFYNNSEERLLHRLEEHQPVRNDVTFSTTFLPFDAANPEDCHLDEGRAWR
ncbi:MAG: hypothetical protein AB9891_09750 [Anaerolineaceae bacterium]